MKALKYLSVVIIGLFLFAACAKELSLESGYAGMVATGSLLDTAGNCKDIAIKGSYIADSSLTDSNYVTVQVNFATGGSYRIFSNTENGFSFQDSGYTSPGLHSIKLKATGKPILPKETTFQVAFDTSFCTFSVMVIGNTPAVFTLISSGPDCANSTIDGTYTKGVTLTTANQVTLEVDVTVAGGYIISTGSVNGMTFSGTGNLPTLGLQIITLQASGVPAVAGDNVIPISAGTSNCSFKVPVGVGGSASTDPNLSDTAWTFTQGTTTYHGPFNYVFDTTVTSSSGSKVYGVGLSGFTSASARTGDTSFFLSTSFPGTTIQPGTTSSRTLAGVALTDYRNTNSPAPIYYANSDPSSSAANTQVTVTSYDPATRIITGTFSGTVLNAAKAVVNITNGRFRGRLR